MKVAEGPAKRRYAMRARAEAAERVSEQLLDAAHEVLLARSYDELTLQEVADRAGTSLSTLLRRFGSKEGLLATLSRSGRLGAARRPGAAGDVAAAGPPGGAAPSAGRRRATWRRRPGGWSTTTSGRAPRSCAAGRWGIASRRSRSGSTSAGAAGALGSRGCSRGGSPPRPGAGRPAASAPSW